jgi:hypothetical protein
MKTLASTVGTVAFVFASGIFASTTVAENPTWNQWRGPDRDGVWPGPLPKSLSSLELVWETQLQPSYSGPVTNGKFVYTTGQKRTSFALRPEQSKHFARIDLNGVIGFCLFK